MKIETSDLWNKIPGNYSEIPRITAYIPDKKTHNSAVIIFPGGGYSSRAPHEGENYAHFLNKNGITAFVVHYRVSPHTFPTQLLDARRAVKFIRYHSEKFGIDKNKIMVMGSSAGGHLASLVSTYFEDISINTENDTIDAECYIPNAQILCYPVISITDEHIGLKGVSFNFMGDAISKYGSKFETDKLVSDLTPPAFIWHTAEDTVVNVINSMRYAEALKLKGIPVEMHIFPDGRHGLGLCDCKPESEKTEKIYNYVSKWTSLLLDWINYIGF